MKINKVVYFAILAVFVSTAVFAQKLNDEYLGLRLEGYNYSYPVKYFDLRIEGKASQMAYMDIPPSGKSQNQTIVLLHGGLAFGEYWRDTIKYLSSYGYRIIVPDQLGFGKSSKNNIHYSIHLLAKNTNELLNYLGIKHAIVIGHSFGGMLAVRFTLMYPDKVCKLILEDPLGLEDYRLKIPFKSIDEVFQLSLHPTWESILNTHKTLYAHWDDKYSEYAQVAYRVSLNPQYSKVAFVQAFIYGMIYSEPIVYELANIKSQTLLIYGSLDRTAPGKAFASEDAQKTLGNFPALVKNAETLIPNIQIQDFDNVGHVPHLEVTKQFNRTVINFLNHK